MWIKLNSKNQRKTLINTDHITSMHTENDKTIHFVFALNYSITLDFENETDCNDYFKKIENYVATFNPG